VVRPDRPFGVRETRRFTDKAAKLLGGLRAWEDIKATLDYDVARDPTSFLRIPETDLYAVQLNTDPPHVVYFTVHEDGYVQYEDIF
jgi:hypothetical protein